MRRSECRILNSVQKHSKPVEGLSAQTFVKLPVISAAENLKKLDERQYLTSWKEIAAYMRCGVRTVQRYERNFGLPIRRPTGKSRGSVMATRAEIDAWVAAGPIRKTFELVRIEQNARTQSQADEIERRVIAMRKLKEEMQELRIETRSAMNMLIDRVSAIRLAMPPARPNGYEPLVNMDNLDVDNVIDRRRRGGRRRNKTFLSTTQKPH